MGNLRTNDTDEFPVESRGGGINYILIPPEPLNEERRRYNPEEGARETYTEVSKYKHFKSTKGEKESLLSELEDIEQPGQWALLGVWKGKHRSDTFELQIPEFAERMRNSDL